jgi:predicted transcriptional regulator
MAQITIYLDDEKDRQIREAARAAGLPVSRLITQAIDEYSARHWPAHIKELVGSWDDVERPEDGGEDLRRSAL